MWRGEYPDACHVSQGVFECASIIRWNRGHVGFIVLARATTGVPKNSGPLHFEIPPTRKFLGLSVQPRMNFGLKSAPPDAAPLQGCAVSVAVVVSLCAFVCPFFCFPLSSLYNFPALDLVPVHKRGSTLHALDNDGRIHSQECTAYSID